MVSPNAHNGPTSKSRPITRTTLHLILILLACGLADKCVGQQSADYAVEQQLAAALAQLAGGPSQAQASPAQLSQAGQSAQLSPISASSSVLEQQASGGSRSRSPRSIGEMFKKFFAGNKRSKSQTSTGSAASASSSAGSSPLSSSAASSAPTSAALAAAVAARDWEQQQALQQQQVFQSQAANMAAAQLAAAAANQHAVYASPFAAYSPTPASAASALYPTFAPAYSPGSLVSWPSTANFGQSLRAPPTTLLGANMVGGAPSGSGPLYAAASQSYNSYVAPPSPSASQAPSSGAASPQAAASHVHSSAVAPPTGAASPAGSALDFHQVLDAFVRTSGFAPAGDQEAAAAQGYAGKAADGGVPVFSFKKLVSLPFYLSTEEKPLDGLAPASSSAGYSLHSIPIMRRHVRRMSASPANQQQPSSEQRNERLQQQQLYNNYANAINNQLASMTANNQIIQYFQQQQQQQQVDAYSGPNEALASYAGYGLKPVRSHQPSSGLSVASSMLAPMAVQAPAGSAQLQPGLSSAQHRSAQEQQTQDLQSLLNGYQNQLNSAPSADPFLLASSSGFMPSQVIGERFGVASSGQQQQLRYAYPAASSHFDPSSPSQPAGQRLSNQQTQQGDLVKASHDASQTSDSDQTGSQAQHSPVGTNQQSQGASAASQAASSTNGANLSNSNNFSQHVETATMTK